MEALINHVTKICLDHHVITEQDEDIFRYGLDLLVFSFGSIVLFLTIGLLLNRFLMVACFLLAFIPMQSFGGGYHANTHLRCFLTMLASLCIAIVIISHLAPIMLLIVSSVCTYPVFRYAPIEHKNAPFGNAFRTKMKKTVRCISSTLVLMSWGFSFTNPLIASSLAMGIIASALSMLYSRRTP